MSLGLVYDWYVGLKDMSVAVFFLFLLGLVEVYQMENRVQNER